MARVFVVSCLGNTTTLLFNMNNPTPSSAETSAKIDALYTQMGHKASIEFLKICIDTLNYTQTSLLQYTHKKDWKQVKTLIHRLLGSANVYDSKKLRNLLQTINDDEIFEQNRELILLEIQTEIMTTVSHINKKRDIFINNSAQ